MSRRNSRLYNSFARTRSNKTKRIFPRYRTSAYSPVELIYRVGRGWTVERIFLEYVEEDPSLEYDTVANHVQKLRKIMRYYIERDCLRLITEELYLSPKEIWAFLNPPKKKVVKEPRVRQRFQATTPEQREKILILRKEGYGPTIIGRFLRLQPVHVRGVLCSAVYRGKLKVQPLSGRTIDWPNLDLKMAFKEMDECLAKHQNQIKEAEPGQGVVASAA